MNGNSQVNNEFSLICLFRMFLIEEMLCYGKILIHFYKTTFLGILDGWHNILVNLNWSKTKDVYFGKSLMKFKEFKNDSFRNWGDTNF